MKRSKSSSLSSESDPSTPKKRTRLSIAQKRDVINKLKGGISVAAVAKQFNVGLQTVRDIKKKESELDVYEINFSSPSNSQRKSLKLPLAEHVDHVTYAWFKAQRAAGTEVSGLMLRMKSLEFNRLLNGRETFTASCGWLDKFNQRHGIRRVKQSGESAGVDAALDYASSTTPQNLEEEQMTISQLYNANSDGTGLFDNATSHEQIEKDGIKAMFLPPNTTSQIQPMDQGPIAALKKQYVSAFMKASGERKEDVDLSTFIKQWSLLKTAFTVADHRKKPEEELE